MTSIYTIADNTALLSHCRKRNIGASFSVGNKVLATGYNHEPKEECLCGIGYQNPKCTHAEKALISKLKLPVDPKGILAVTYQPCTECARLIINAGIKTVHFKVSKPHQTYGVMLMKSAGLTVLNQWE